MAEGEKRKKRPPFCGKVARTISEESITGVPGGGRPITFSLAHDPLRCVLSWSALTDGVEFSHAFTSWSFEPNWVAYTTGYQYDKDGNLVSETYPDGRQITYVFNAVNLPVNVNETGSNGLVPVAYGISYDKVGNLLTLVYGNGLAMQGVYDAANRLSQMSVPGILNLSYARDHVGNITSITDLVTPANSQAFGYDALYRLETAQGPWGNQSYTYDANGNRLFETGSGLDTNITANGNLNFVYNQSNRLAEVINGATVVGEYTYNGKGQRVEKNVPASGMTLFHYDMAGRLIEETNANGQVIADYIYLGRGPLAMVAPASGQDQIYFYHNDHLGSPGFMTDQSRNFVWTGSFEPFGNAVSVSGSITNNLRFSGQYFDKETGLNYNGNRYYDPSIGRYIRPDPIGLFGGLNRYVYVQNDPVNRIDPLDWNGSILNQLVSYLINHQHPLEVALRNQ